MTRENQKTRSRNAKLERLIPLLLGWFHANARDLPWRRTRDPYAIWVSEIMLQQTQVRTVIPYWERWMREMPTIEALAAAGSARIHKLWEGLGYYTRVRNLQKAARLILEKPEGRFPEAFEDVLALPGIGRYTAGAICSIAFNQPAPILDGNVIRVLTRVFGIAANPRERKTNDHLWQLAGELVHHASRATRHTSPCSGLNQSLMELGALICTPRSPQCSACPIRKQCVAFRENRVAQLPRIGKRAAATPRRFVAFVIESEGRFLVRRRPAGVVNAHLWEFPNQEQTGAAFDLHGTAHSILHLVPQRLSPLCTIKHAITRYRVTLDAFVAGGISDRDRARLVGRWLTPAQMEKLSFPSAHRKILQKLRTHRPIDSTGGMRVKNRVHPCSSVVK